MIISDPPPHAPMDKMGNNRWWGLREAGPWAVLFDVPIDTELPMYLSRSHLTTGTCNGVDDGGRIETLIRNEKRIVRNNGGTHSEVTLTAQDVVPAMLKGPQQR